MCVRLEKGTSTTNSRLNGSPLKIGKRRKEKGSIFVRKTSVNAA